MKRWQLPISYLARETQPSWLSRHFLFAWHIVVLCASWYPFTGWRYTGEGVFAFFFYPLPYYQTSFDNVINFLAYMPLGFAWALAFRCRWYAPLLALLCGGMLSGLVEFVQQFLPDRVASNLDLLCNSAGCLAGAIVGCLFEKLTLVRRWHVARQAWFAKGALVDYGLTLMVLWLLAQSNPAVPLFGVVVEPVGIPQSFVSPIGNPALFLRVLETSGVMLHVTAVGLLTVTLLARRSRAARAVWGLLIFTTLMKTLFAGAMLKPGQFLAWLNIDVVMGAAAATALLTMGVVLKRRWQALAALACLGLAELVEAEWPLHATPYSVASLFRWRYGHLQDFNGLTQTMSELWPYLAGIYLIGVAMRDISRSRESVLPQ
ncbi:MAG: VanZ family protein [Burkholderiales bacterium]|nr:VanZ family protein [Burkholderiales bacterium]